MLIYLLQGIGCGFAAAVQPGPFQTYLISQTLKNGWRRTLPAALAPLVSDGPILALVLLVLSQMPVWLTRFLYIAGGCFILYLAVGAFRAWRGFVMASPVATESSQQSVFKAAMMNALNPNPYIYWSLVTGPILIAGWRETPFNGMGFLLGFYVTIVSTMAGTIALFGLARQLGPRVNRALLGISAVALACFGLYQLWRGL
jgi:threonine/homoserine/homoserine lactone efflux protein